MNFIEIPNLPASDLRLAVVDGRIGTEIESSLLKKNIRLIKTRPVKHVYEAVAWHPDIMIHHVGNNKIVHAPGTDPLMLKALQEYGFELICGDTELTSAYPGNVAYNAARVGSKVFHNDKYMDSILRDELYKAGVELVNVKQGYSKCSISVVDNNSIITSDKGIAGAAEKNGLDVLLIEPDEGIALPGLDYGFIGGSTGLLGPALWAIAGSAESLKAFTKIYDFLTAKNIEIVSLSHGYVTDIGSILGIAEK